LSTRSAAILAAAFLVPCALPAPAVRITEYTVPTATSLPYAICLGPDGRLWFTEAAGNKVGAMTTSGNFDEYPVPSATSLLTGITAVPINGLFAAEFSTRRIARVSIGGTVTESAPLDTSPELVIQGPDGRAWVSAQGVTKEVLAIGNLTNAPSAAAFSTTGDTFGMVVGANGDIWFTEPAASKIGWVSPEGGSVHEFDTPTPAAHPTFIANAPNNDQWFTEAGANKIGRRFGGTTTILEYSIPTPSAQPGGITLGPDGNMWFTEYAANKIARITTGSTPVITEFPAAGGPIGITLGPDGNLYFAEYDGNKIGKLEISVPGDMNGDGAVDVSDVFYLINFLFAGGPAPVR
jgi:virginiamycin B lyase